jgi:hypothetical protein
MGKTFALLRVSKATGGISNSLIEFGLHLPERFSNLDDPRIEVGKPHIRDFHRGP